MRTRLALATTAVAVAAIVGAGIVASSGDRAWASDAPAAAAELDDATIVAIFDAANTADMETGALAAERGASKEVRDFGTMLVHDHEQVRAQGRALARRLGVTPTPPKDDASAREHTATLTRLKALKGAAFDRAFLAHEVAFHRAVLDAARGTLLPAIENDELRAFVTKVAPAFEGHMVGAQAIARRLDGAK